MAVSYTHLEDVVRAYEGEDAARHVREVLAENQGEIPANRDPRG